MSCAATLPCFAFRKIAGENDERIHAGESVGPLAGLPCWVGDNIYVEGMPCTAGCASFGGFYPSFTAELVSRAQAAGAVIMGKGTVGELSLSPGGNSAYGAVLNPYDSSRVAGGSAGGTATLIGGRVAQFAVVTDIRGCARLPAALCGVVGMRASAGRYPAQAPGTDGAHGATLSFTSTLDGAGAQARCVRDLQLLDAVLAGEEVPAQAELSHAPSLRGVRVGVPRSGFCEDLDEKTGAAFEAALRVLREAGAEVVDVTARLGTGQSITALAQTVADTLIAFEMPRQVEVLTRQRKDVGEALASSEEGGDARGMDRIAAALRSQEGVNLFFNALQPDSEVTPAKYAAVLTESLPAAKDAWQRMVASVDLVVYPVSPIQPPASDAEWTEFTPLWRNTTPASIAGAPAVALPTTNKMGLPVGIEFAGAHGHDDMVLRVARAFQEVVEGGPNVPSKFLP